MSALDQLVGEFFKGSPAWMQVRKALIVFGALLAWLMMALIAHPPAFTATLITSLGEFVSALVKIPIAPKGLNTAFLAALKLGIVTVLLAWEVLRAMFAANVFRHVLAFGLPILVSYRLAVLYLDDIFDLNDQKTAFRYLRAAAFGIRPYKLTIENGDVAPQDKQSPILLIGGPGEVQVNLENVAIFDQMDGEPHIVGPTLDKTDHTELLGSFERLRDIIDLRDQMTRNNELSAQSRTRDGIPVMVRDVRMLYSVQRDQAPSAGGSSHLVYTYKNDAIFNLAYNRPPGPWTASMTRLVRRSLQDFLATHTLSEILATVGLPEIEDQRTQATRIGQQAEALYPAANTEFIADSQPVDVSPNPPPNFVPRLRLTDLFYEKGSSGFQNQARQRGVQLHWIDVGTLWIQPGPIPDFQVEAWRMTVENNNRQKELEELEDEGRLDELIRMINEVPLITYRKSSEAGKDADQITADLIADYHGLLRSAQDVYTQEGKPVPPRLEAAIRITGRYINNYLKRTGQARYL